MKGLIVAGGNGTRLSPITLCLNKHLLPVYDKPMIYYSLAILLQAGIRDIVLVTHAQALPLFQQLLLDGSQWGINLHYITQPKPHGIGGAIIAAQNFIDGDRVCVVLGDNVLYGDDLPSILQQASRDQVGAQIFAYRVSDPERYGVVVLDKQNQPIAIYEKPQQYVSDLAVIGLYFFPSDVAVLTEYLKPSKRGELEISDINNAYLKQNLLSIYHLPPHLNWFDVGTQDSLLETANCIQQYERRLNRKVACIEEIVRDLGYIDNAQLEKLARTRYYGEYQKYLLGLLNCYNIP